MKVRDVLHNKHSPGQPANERALFSWEEPPPATHHVVFDCINADLIRTVLSRQRVLLVHLVLTHMAGRDYVVLFSQPLQICVILSPSLLDVSALLMYILLVLPLF